MRPCGFLRMLIDIFTDDGNVVRPYEPVIAVANDKCVVFSVETV